MVTTGTDAIRVLHIDDEPGFAEMTARHLERHDERLSVTPSTDPGSALGRLRAEEFDCVVSDYEMPGTDGLELLERVRERDERMPFVLFTGRGSEEIAGEAISAGVTDYLRKGTGTEQYEVLANRVTNAVEHARAERRARRGYRALNTAWDGIAILDGDGEFVFANTTYAATVGRPPGALEGRHWATLYPAGEADEVRDDVLPVVREGGVWTGEKVVEAGDGTRRLLDHAVAGMDDGGVACVVRDVTERRELHRQLERERERFRLLVDSVEEYAVFLLDAEGYVRSWNAGAERITGYESHEVLGEHASRFYPDEAVDEGLPGRLLEAAVAEGSVSDTGWRVRKDGSRFWADVTVTALHEDGELAGFAKITEDRTDGREREERRERAEEARKELYRVTTDPGRGFEGTLRDVLQLGVEYLGVENGHLVSVDPAAGRHEVVAVSDDHPVVTEGGVADLSETYCRRTIEADHLLGVHDAVEEGWADDPAYERFGLGCYLGSKLEVDGELYGTVCFVDRDPRDEPFRHDEKLFVELVARWLTVALWRREGGTAP